ncbi:protein-glutamine gamma-glutamyltransferase [Bacillus sp. B190/17]|uniref:Protein-glutamine gamma-glutamyltransferase n=1 Tax=Bacillus lumedeiriae TaxID=3058829 RepID=A0ABW8I8Z2_9BACI
MIQLSGMPFQQSNMWPPGSIENIIVQQMIEDPIVYSYQSFDELSFELELRKNIILSARALNQSNPQFAVFANARSNPQYWYLTSIGGFRLRPDVRPSDAIRDIYMNSSQYAFECATAMLIIYYHAVLNVMGEFLFNQLFQGIYLYSWHADPDLGITSKYTERFLPGDIAYFKNPDFNPEAPQWRGENAVILEDGTYFGHGIGIGTAEQIIGALNQGRIPGSVQSAYLTNLVVRPSFEYLARISKMQRDEWPQKSTAAIIQHNKSSIPYDQYVFLLNLVYKNKKIS